MSKEDLWLQIRGRRFHEELLPTALSSRGMAASLICGQQWALLHSEGYMEVGGHRSGSPERQDCSWSQRTNQMTAKSPFLS